MGTVVGLFRRRRDAVRAWRLLRQQGFEWSELRIVPCDRFLQERLHPTISSARTIRSYMCASGGALLGGLSGMLAGLAAFAVADPSPVFMLAMAGAGLGSFSGSMIGRYDPLNLVLAQPPADAAVIAGGAVLVRVVASGERAVRAGVMLRRADATKVFSVDQG